MTISNGIMGNKFSSVSGLLRRYAIAAILAAVVLAAIIFTVNRKTQIMTREGLHISPVEPHNLPGFSFSVRRDARENFNAAISRFSESLGFSVRILRTPKPSDSDYLTFIKGNLAISCSDNSNEGAQDISYSLSFGYRPPSAIAENEIEKLKQQYRNAIQKIDGVIRVE